MKRKWIYVFVLVVVALVGCKKQPSKAVAQSPVFSADSAYEYIRDQVSFGPRVPGTMAHYDCAMYLQKKLEGFGWAVRSEQGLMTDYKGDNQPVYNIIASLNPQIKQRILLCAHWDTRPWADEEDDYELRMKPVLGANDGASGVGVLLEVARELGKRQADSVGGNLGVDIVLFDCEDMGTPDFYTGKQTENTWCLGSQFWSDNYKKYGTMLYKGTKYKYGILLDMVGGTDAVFPKEYHSMEFASQYVEKIWRNAQRLGYGKYFVDQYCYPITDDHYYVSTIAGVPCVDIIHYSPDSDTGFASFWHTTRDDMSNINKQTLQVVGEVVLATIMN